MPKNVLMTDLRVKLKSFASAKVMALLCLLVLSVVSAKAQTPYVIWCEDIGTLYFTNSTETYAQGGNYEDHAITAVWSGDDVTKSGETPNWGANQSIASSVQLNCKQIAIDESFQSVKPTSLSAWFSYMQSLTEIKGLQYLNTSEATTMKWMFASSEKLTSLDLSHFNTSKVTDMSGMFYDCKGLTSLNLNSFDVSKVANFADMFVNCSALSTIFCENDWSTASTPTNSTNMFYGCSSLKGGNGSSASNNNSSITYARPDGGTDAPGYFTKAAYAIWCEGNTTLYFTNAYVKYAAGGIYNEKTITQVWNGDAVTNSGDSPQWLTSVQNSCTEVVFAQDFSEAKPTSLKRWFYRMSKLTTIAGLANLNASEATDMSDMFQGSAVKSIDLSWSNTDKVTNMSGMFANCTGLTSLNLNDINTANVTNMRGMFAGCTGLTEIELDRLNTGNVTNMSEMFNGCTTLMTLDISSLNTANVTDMSNMFYGCVNISNLDMSNFDTRKVTNMNGMFQGTGLTKPDLSSFNVANVQTLNKMFMDCTKLESIVMTDFFPQNATSMSNMFNGCAMLTTIYCDYDWKTNNSTNSVGMFSGCTSLKGSNGTAYDASRTTIDYAHPDEEDNPGYFTGEDSEPNIYAIWCESNNTLYFTQSKKHYKPGRTYDGQAITYAWTGYDNLNYKRWKIDEVTDLCMTVTFDESFSTVQLVNLFEWFKGMAQLSTINGLEYLNTSAATSMKEMFAGCANLGTIDVTHFDTRNVESMKGMFYGCPLLHDVDVSNFKTENVTDMSEMFAYCRNLPSGDTGLIGLDYLNTSNVTTMSKMFYNCSSLRSLRLYNFDTSKVMYMNSMFEGCSLLHGIQCNDDWKRDENWPQGDNMFLGCSGYVEYSEDKVNIDYAHPMEEGNFGYFEGGDYKQRMAVLWCEDNKTLYFTGGKEKYAVGDTYQGHVVSDTWGPYDYWMNAEGTNYQDLSDDVKELFGIREGEIDKIDRRPLHLWIADGSPVPAQCEYVVFEESVAETTPVNSMSFWFYNFSKLKSIQGLEYLNTGNKENSYYTGMFAGCSSLESIDLSHFITVYTEEKETTDQEGEETTNSEEAEPQILLKHMGGMFYNCSSLKSLDLSAFNTSEVQVMKNLFAGCSSLTDLKLGDSFSTANVENMAGMFDGCASLTDIDLSGFETDKVTSMRDMFKDCAGLTEVDLRHANNKLVTDMSQMFYGCTNLKTVYLNNFSSDIVTDLTDMFKNDAQLTTIYCNYDWTDKVGANTGGMFYGCTNIMGGKGSGYKGTDSDGIWYARPDEGSSAPGYFTKLGVEPCAIWFAENKTLLFTCPTKQYAPGDTFDEWVGNLTVSAIWSGDAVTNSGEVPQWTVFGEAEIVDGYSDVQNNCSQVYFDESFKDVKPTSLAHWFYHFDNLSRIEGLEYLNTSDATSMLSMFSVCVKLSELDLSHFNTEKVTNMAHMFSYCANLYTLDVSHFNTSNVVSMGNMFDRCLKLTSLDLNSFDVSKVSEFYEMFRYCEALTTIYCNNDWKIDSSKLFGYDMFYGCRKLKGGNGTGYYDVYETTGVGDIENPNDQPKEGLNPFEYARPDVEGTPGFFTNDLDEPVPYAIWSEDNKTLYFTKSKTRYAAGSYYNKDISENATSAHEADPAEPLITAAWSGTDVTDKSWRTTDVIDNCERVVFDKSFSDVKPEDLSNWFKDFSQLGEIDSLQYLNTSAATTMAGMFSGCASLTALDVSHFKTENVTDMSEMFAGCSSTSLTSIEGHQYLNTSNVTTMARMFYNCSSVLKLLLYNFDTSKVKDMTSMFEGCSELLNIICDADWKRGYNKPTGDDMFKGCISLDGYTADKVGIDQAHPNEEGDLGYFTARDNTTTRASILWCEGNKTLYFTGEDKPFAVGDNYKDQVISEIYNYDQASAYKDVQNQLTINLDRFGLSDDDKSHVIIPDWLLDESPVPAQCEYVVFDETMANTESDISTAFWFYGFSKLKSIEGLGYLDTSYPNYYMTGMFAGCSSLESVDLSKFNTTYVTQMAGMFYDCSSLTSLDLSSFNTEDVRVMKNLFANCSSLTEIKLGDSFDTKKVEDMAGMFSNCSSLTDIDLSGFNTEKVTTMNTMFANCSSLETLDLTGFNTGNVTNMEGMLKGCAKLQMLDLNNIIVSQVRNMNEMFYGCTDLKTIYCEKDWSEENISTSTDMFTGCTSLVGVNGSTLETAKLTSIKGAHPDKEGDPGYFTDKLVYEYTLTEAKIGTLYLNFPAVIPTADAFNVYYVSSIDDSKNELRLTEIKGVIPANTAVIIFGNSGTYKMEKSEEEPKAITDNILKGVTKATSVADLKSQHGTDIYVLSRAQNSYIGFRKAGGTVKTIPANRAYLPYTSSSNAQELSISFEDEEATGISDIAGSANSGETKIYNLAGQRVTNPQHGIYIVNGKKVYIP